MIDVGLLGASGRVGQLIIEEIKKDENYNLSSVLLGRSASIALPSGTTIALDFEELLKACEVLIDFSTASATEELLKASLKAKSKTPLVIGTTALSSEGLAMIHAISEMAPIFYSANFSRGVAVLQNLAKITAKALSDAEVEISETHHRYKVDSPSGTALALASSVASGRDIDLENHLVYNRSKARANAMEINISSLRAGEIVGNHAVGFYLDGEYLELSHIATDRKTFAIGALRAAGYLIEQKAGLYNMTNLLGL